MSAGCIPCGGRRAVRAAHVAALAASPDTETFQADTAAVATLFGVWDGGVFTGRRFTSARRAARYAQSRGPDAEVRQMAGTA